MIRIIAIGKRHDARLQGAIEDYQKRLKAPYDTQWLLVPHSSYEGDQARAEESKRLLERIAPEDYAVLLDERGKLLDNAMLHQTLSGPLEASKRLVIIIGGAYGVDGTVRQRADAEWSLSPLVFPHQLVRLLVVEQLYRSQSLGYGHPYHHA